MNCRGRAVDPWSRARGFKWRAHISSCLLCSSLPPFCILPHYFNLSWSPPLLERLWLLLSLPYVVLIWHQWSDVAFYNINKHTSERCIMQIYWMTLSVIYIEVIGCFGSFNIIHPRPGDPAETMFCVPAAFAYDSALLIQSHFFCGFSCASNSSYTNILWWVASYLKD